MVAVVVAFGSVGAEMDDRRLQLEKAMDAGCA